MQKKPTIPLLLPKWEKYAYLIDIYRIFPRSLFLLASVGMWKIVIWYMYGLMPVERTGEVSAFVAVVVGAWAKLADWYMQRGVDWDLRLKTIEGRLNVIPNNNSTPLP